ncbi:CPBP family intramembrane glutamic endopeptidase [Kitasatospora sp. CM 4170]|uniref:CPBP family intramembrane glutamic endopeptidase n=1 Tax=Kitasatospora aburaviensis TaxID=67265 RepID=A0ABW1ER64_9ACTN|nr:CPBP family intramembrane glutamic endopeptidase [Kitasatospora sp. CM 4170]WNM44520.1 CPBP family intramembrane glutamic endopeptidase [Kitasatospora sp. CM 4170]
MTGTEPSTGRLGGMREWKAEAGVFLSVAFVAAGVLGAVQPGTGIPTGVVQLTQFGPAAGVAVLALLRPARTRRRLAGALPGPRGADGSAGREALLLLTAPLIVVLGAGTYALLGGDARLTDPRTLEHPFALVVAAQLVGACGEEIGWRCLLQPLVRSRFGPLTASALVGLVWGLWHVQVLAQAPAYAAGFLAATVAMSVVLGLGLERVRANRLLLAGGFHTLVNLGMLLTMDEESGAVLPMVLFGAACLVAAVPWVLRGPAVSILTPAHGAR